MKTYISIFFLCTFIFSNGILHAKKVESKMASQVAINVFAERSGMTRTSVQVTNSLVGENKGEPIYHIFNMNPNGFIIVSADDVVEPILGYSFNTHFDFDNAPPALLSLLDGYKNEILYVKEKGVVQDTELSEKWDSYLSDNYGMEKSYSPGSYLLKTRWYQSGGFNDECPDDPNTQERCIVGCVPVSLGQILHYWGCLVTPQGSKTYTPDNFPSSLSVNFGSQTYDWDAMGHYNSDAHNAELLYHCGVAVEADYTDSSTSAYASAIENALENYFGFQTSGYVNKSSYSSSTWATKIRNEISAYRPVQYRGDDDTTGHAWVVDGYNNSNEFHCNWGWSTSWFYNGFYLLTDLTPGSSDYNNDQAAIMGIQPIHNCFNDISGDDIVCSSNETFSVSVPSCCSVEWTKSSYLNQVGGNTGSTFTVNSTISTFCTSGWVKATFKNSDGDIFLTKTKYFGINGPEPADLDLVLYTTSGSPVSYMCPNTHYHIYIENDGGCSLSNYSWTIPTAWNKNYQSSNMISVYTNSSPWGSVDVNATTSCNNNVKVITDYFGSGYCPSSLSLTFSPNPVTIETTLTIDSRNDEEKILINDDTWSMEIYNSNQMLIQKATKIKGTQYQINTSTWKEGVYYVRVIYGEEIISGKLVVKK